MTGSLSKQGAKLLRKLNIWGGELHVQIGSLFQTYENTLFRKRSSYEAHFNFALVVLEFGTFIIAAAFANVFVLLFADHFCLISSGQLVAKSPQRPPSRFVDDQCHVVSQKPVHTAHTH